MSTEPRRLYFSPQTERELVNLSMRSKKGEYLNTASASQLKAVYFRGAASSVDTSHLIRHESGMTRVLDFLKGRNASDDDLKSITASAVQAELSITVHDESFYATPEHAIFAITAYAGLGLDKAPAFRAAWLRGVNENDSPFERAKNLAVDLYSSPDADLLPKEGKK